MDLVCTSKISAIPSGIYQCDIPISKSRNATFYVGIFEAEGGLFTVHYVVLIIVVSPHILVWLIILSKSSITGLFPDKNVQHIPSF